MEFYDYTLTASPEDGHILIQGDNLNAFDGTMEGSFTDEGFVTPFSQENALKLRTFLRGRKVKLGNKDKKYLQMLADGELEDVENKEWASSLVHLHEARRPGKRLGKIVTEWDLLHWLPLRYLDKTNPQNIDELVEDEWSVIVGEIATQPEWDEFRQYTKILIQDINGKRVSAVFFKQKWLSWMFKEGDPVVAYGTYSVYTNKRTGRKFPQIINCKIDKIDDNTNMNLPMVPVYPQKAGNKSWELQQEIKSLLDRILFIEDPVPPHILKKYNLMSRDEAYRKIHFPANREEAERARERIAFDDFIRLQVLFYKRRQDINETMGVAKTHTLFADHFVSSLPFELTGAQKRVTSELREDLAKPEPMYRLLQGEVGSGKSEIALFTSLIAVESGYQVAFLAPTDILAAQMAERIERDLKRSNINVSVSLVTSKMKVKEKRELLAQIAAGEVDISVGTHALIQKGVSFKNLGLVIVDEQHKFGTEQRSALREANKEGGTPDMLTMSATPIPRTTSQVVYGDMDISIIDELPAERQPIDTIWSTYPDDAWDLIREQVDEGRQAYVVASLVEDSEALADIESATETYHMLSNVEFRDLKVGLLHGKMDAEAKKQVIEAFYRNDVQVLVATTVVEVGVNVPNASVMVVLNANRFGIASLHQIRGRVGRGKHKSYCYLIGEATTPEATQRLTALTASGDGFWLAEKDLEIRGEGTLFDTKQSGDSGLMVGNLRHYKNILGMAKECAAVASSSQALNDEITILYEGKKIGA